MWDIVWTDPSRELVGEHRARKESSRKRGQPQQQAERHPQIAERSSLSTTSSRSSTAESAFARFRARGLKQAQSSSQPQPLSSSFMSSSRSSPSPHKDNPKPTPAQLNHQQHSITPDGGYYYHSPPRASASVSESTASLRSSVSVSGDLIDHIDSVFGTPASSCSPHSRFAEPPSPERTRGKPTAIHPAVQATGNHSPASDRPAGAARRRLARIISSPSSARPGGPPPRLFELQSPVRSAFVPLSLCPGEPLTPPRFLPAYLGFTDTRHPYPDLPVKSSLRGRGPAQALPTILDGIKAGHAVAQGGFAPTHPVRSKMTTDTARTSLPTATPSSLRQFWKPPDFEAYTRDVKAMATVPAATALSRIEELGSSGVGGDQQSQTDVERMRWMFSTLHHLDIPALTDVSRRKPAINWIPPHKVHNILALYESKASASYLAGLHPTKRICHLSDKPLPLDALPNVQPLFVSGISPTTFPIPPGLFEAVYALSLPAMCSAQELRGVMQNVHSCLKPGGTLNLTLIDPLPRAETLGKTLRAWLEQHLLANLEKQSRCMSPVKQLPQWLGELSLRGAGSTLTTAKFYATPDNVRQLPRDPDPTIEKLHAERRTKAELRSLVGRMLWMEVWGPLVTADFWWWDDPACVEECLELGTFWEYHLIEAIKDG
ncbi:hypothetical protein HIM_01500 [Hirsutella minnesotensis 3608]|nr:hypothetical protein HIM_01500 [Hirsutella minnesotensis 3608]